MCFYLTKLCQTCTCTRCRDMACAWSVCLCVCWSQLWALQKQMNQSSCRLWTQAHTLRPKEPCIRWDPDPPKVRGNFWGEWALSQPIVKYREYLGCGWYSQNFNLVQYVAAVMRPFRISTAVTCNSFRMCYRVYTLNWKLHNNCNYNSYWIIIIIVVLQSVCKLCIVVEQQLSMLQLLLIIFPVICSLLSCLRKVI